MLQSLQLLFRLGRIKAHADGVLLRALFKEDAVRLQVGGIQCAFNLCERLLGHLDRSLAGRNLHGWRFAVEIRQRINEPDNEHDADQYVFPKRIAIHSLFSVLTKKLRGPGAAPSSLLIERKASKDNQDVFRSPSPGLREPCAFACGASGRRGPAAFAMGLYSG